MATYPLVNIQNDLGPLMKLSLLKHDIPATAMFEVIEESSGTQFVAVATPIADEQGDREAYLKIFTALNDESFSTPYLRLHTLVLSSAELQQIRRVLKKGISEAYLGKLAHLGEVVVRPTEEPRNVVRSGMLQVSRSGNGIYRIIFVQMDAHSKPKGRNFANLEEVRECLRKLRVGVSADLNQISRMMPVSFAISASLEELYGQGLI